MKSIKLSAALFALVSMHCHAQPDWNLCRYQVNPQQCMQGIPPYQQTIPKDKDMEPGLSRGNPNFQLQGGYKEPNPAINCRPDGVGGMRCQQQ